MLAQGSRILRAAELPVLAIEERLLLAAHNDRSTPTMVVDIEDVDQVAVEVDLPRRCHVSHKALGTCAPHHASGRLRRNHPRDIVELGSDADDKEATCTRHQSRALS